MLDMAVHVQEFITGKVSGDDPLWKKPVRLRPGCVNVSEELVCYQRSMRNNPIPKIHFVGKAKLHVIFG